MKILYLFFAYLLGSLPFGYLVTRFSTGQNILEIGWRKTSGSNVFKNVGQWQGILTGVLDIGKGFLAVWLAKKLGFSLSAQVLAGVAAVIGHNWSLFLNFSGGRGIGTLGGSLFALSPKIFGFALIPLASLALIWNASIGTILALITALILAIYYHQPEVVVLILISAIPIFIKRLSPIKEIFPPQNKLALIRNRLIFDNDQLCLDLRIKRIIKNLTK